MSKKILIINGPNLNLLGEREKSLYGDTTLDKIKLSCEKFAETKKIKLVFFQSNIEGEIVEKIQEAKKNFAGIVINAAGYTHTSVSILDALLAIKLPVIELHISNIYSREEFRQKSLISRAAKGIICGFGSHGYIMALEGMLNIIRENEDK